MSNNELVRVNLPMLIKLAQPAASLKLLNSRIRSVQNGRYLSVSKGRGMEFDEIRPYQMGDDIRTIDWRVTARTGKTHTKLFREERERPVFISVDYRASMQFATRGVFKAVQAAKLAALLAWVAQHQGDKVGGQVFTDYACQEIKPQNGKQAVLHFLNNLVKKPPLTDNNLNFTSHLKRLAQHVKSGSLVYIISDFRGLNAAAEKLLSNLARHCELVLIFIYDPLEISLPKQGRYRVIHQQATLNVDTTNKQGMAAYQLKFQQHRDYLQQLAIKLNSRLLECSSIDNPVTILRQ